MKRKIFFVCVSILLSINMLNAQNGKLKGVVQYQYNDYVGYKVDVGAEVYVVLKQNAPSLFDISKWNDYEKSAVASIKWWDYLNGPASTFPGLDADCVKQLELLMEKIDDIALVDNSGKYELELPYGEYYVIAKSKNRSRSFSITEKEGRILVKEVVISKPTTILSFDFDY